MGIENNKLSANELDNVSGGMQIIQDKNGEYWLVGDNAKKFTNKEDAKAASKMIQKITHNPLELTRLAAIKMFGGTSDELEILKKGRTAKENNEK